MLPMSQTAPPIPVVSYARISADCKGDEHGVRDQHKVNSETAARYGWTVVHEFTDNDKSAAKADVVRGDFEAMLKALKAGKLPDGKPVSGIVVLADDRLTRRPGDYERFVEAFTHQDGRVFADARGTKNLYCEDVESMGLFGAVISKMEVRKMQRRMRRSHRARAEEGRPSGGPRPFGWKLDRLTLDKVEADLLRQAAADFLTGRSLHSVVREWQDKGIRTSLGNDWSVRSLKVALLNPRICGWRELDGELVRDASGEPVQGQWAPIITGDEWNAIRAVFGARKGHFIGRDGKIGRRHPADYRDPTYLLSGILRCGNTLPDGNLCNTPLRVNRGKDAPHHVYTCLSKAEGGCGGVSRRGDLVDLFVSEAVLAKLEEGALVDASDSGEWDKEELLQDSINRLDELTRQWQAKAIGNELFFSLAPGLEKEIADYRTEKTKHDASAQLRQSRKATDVEKIRKRWYLLEDEGGLPISTKRTYIREALHAVIMYPAGKGNKKFDPDKLDPIWREN
ncbi:recombinase family protein [Nonomuraea sp. NPDC001636]|uniref:recombinase family protein n=1 Tax=Nonomuraea sp. NPDC001636 TaxID=3154391 RepID=UPI00332AC226